MMRGRKHDDAGADVNLPGGVEIAKPDELLQAQDRVIGARRRLTEARFRVEPPVLRYVERFDKLVCAPLVDYTQRGNLRQRIEYRRHILNARLSFIGVVFHEP